MPLLLLASQILLGINALLLALLLFTRLRLRYLEQRNIAFKAHWEPIFLQSLIQVPEELPALPSQEWQPWAELLNFHLESVRGHSQERLISLANRLNLPTLLLQHLQRGPMRERILAAYTLGNLHCEQAWQPLTAIVFKENSLMALTALRALLQMSPLAAFPILEKALEQYHWSYTRLAGIFQRSGKQALALPLGRALREQQGTSLPLLIRLVGAIQAHSLLPQVHQLLSERPEVEIKAACLEVMGILHDFSGKELIYAYLKHPDWQLRLQATAALGEIARDQDIPSLLTQIQDCDPWIGRIAAQGIGQIPGMDQEKLARLRQRQGDEKVRNLLRLALAEKKFNP